ncbi:hypothetical protein DFH09DRAFT_923959, partial [Mycena vulgaris]
SVRNFYLRCGHAESLVSQVVNLCPHPPSAHNVTDSFKVKCGDTHCKFSPNHPAGCVPPSCTRTCAQ